MIGIDWLIVLASIGFILVTVLVTKKHTKTVAGFLAADRCAGKYLLAIGDGAAGLGAITIVANMQMYYENGFTAIWWNLFMIVPISFIIPISGFVIYRFRETRSLTMAEFFERRYSRKFRVFSGFLAFTSGVINFGLFPAVGTRFFMYFCGFPPTIPLFGFDCPVYPLMLIVVISVSVYLTFVGGQISVILADFFQGAFP